ncbi:hypothetical protein T03_15623 [Trichinella britovi]|uniref:Uncharacterized protein n=1 Tax=Trichinella britovi TaxID=45882 RepID=A0A0V1BHN8_TRIBR|nr:hypothetical protein T03_15623 [Trichinella britovi]
MANSCDKLAAGQSTPFSLTVPGVHPCPQERAGGSY